MRTLARQEGGIKGVAFSFAVGVFLGFSPLVGLHTILGLAIAVLFRLNKVAVLLGVYLNNPWVFFPYYAFATWVGLKLTGMSTGIELSRFKFSDLLSHEFWMWLSTQWKLVIPAVIGSTVLSILFAVIAYPLGLLAISRFRSKGMRFRS